MLFSKWKSYDLELLFDFNWRVCIELFGFASMVLCRTLDKTISKLETELADARAAQESIMNGSPVSDDFKLPETVTKRKYLMVVGVNTAFSSRKRRDSVRATWMPPGMLI